MTPALLLDEQRLERNIERMRAQCARFQVPLRPHVKTSKCFEVIERCLRSGARGATVSTLAEARQVLSHGITDIVYAVGIAPAKLPEVALLRASGADLTIILDTREAALEVTGFAARAQQRLAVLIEIDSDGHRAGITPQDPALIEVATILARSRWIELRGVLTHAGESYRCTTPSAVSLMAAQERQAVLDASAALHAAGLPCSLVSAGSTPTVLLSQDLSRLSEVRAGVYMFQDLVMAGIGVCTLDEIALTVLTSVIGHRRSHGQIIIDAGWMALSRDRGTAGQSVDQGYGVVCDEDGAIIEDVIVMEANQEHGIAGTRSGISMKPADFPVGRRLRILPNHACATAAQHAAYHVIGEASEPKLWSRSRGW